MAAGPDELDLFAAFFDDLGNLVLTELAGGNADFLVGKLHLKVVDLTRFCNKTIPSTSSESYLLVQRLNGYTEADLQP